uniref:SH3 domain-containing protein n=1 Tax=Guillardia theta TaxID=55529 RepID=A0A7S4PD03_GUITH|mmetsp:Transcript_48183/g.151173  ORF Transcript_48183/g.151173 Transcript_48183/m.151173 type:complete len:481 (+) Transcript_48183:3-1445(+)
MVGQGGGRWWVGMLLYCALHAATRALESSETSSLQHPAFIRSLPVSDQCRASRIRSSFVCMAKAKGERVESVRAFEVGDAVLTDGKSGVLTQYNNGWWTVTLQEGSVVKRRAKALSLGKQPDPKDLAKPSTVSVQSQQQKGESSSPVAKEAPSARNKRGGRASHGSSEAATPPPSDAITSENQGDRPGSQTKRSTKPSTARTPKKKDSDQPLTARYPQALQAYLESLSNMGESLAVQEELPTMARYPQALQDLLSGKNVKVKPARRKKESQGVQLEETFVARYPGPLMRYLESQQLEDDLDDSLLGPQDSEDDFYEEDTPLSASYPPALEYLLSGDYLEDNDMEDGNIKQVRDAEWFLGRKGFHFEELKGDFSPDDQRWSDKELREENDSDMYLTGEGLSYPLPQEESGENKQVLATESMDKKKQTMKAPVPEATTETKLNDVEISGKDPIVQDQPTAGEGLNPKKSYPARERLGKIYGH